MNSDSIITVARTHLPDVFTIMVIAATIFIAAFVWVILPTKFKLLNQWGRHILRQAPSIMTALGLFGTFYGLTESLRTFGTDVEQIQLFISELKSVFIYSILGIGSAAMFMVLNVIANAVSHNRVQYEKHLAIAQQHQQIQTNQKNNEAVLQYLAAQLTALNQLNQTLKNHNFHTSDSAPIATTSADFLAEWQRSLQQQSEFAPYLAELANIQEMLNKTVTKLLIPYTKASNEYHEHTIQLLTQSLNRQPETFNHEFQQQMIENNQILLKIYELLSSQPTQTQPQVATTATLLTPVESASNKANVDPFHQLEQELAALRHENEKLFTQKY